MDTVKLYVGGISYKTKRDELAEAFAPYGEVICADIVEDRETNQSKGFGFVTIKTRPSHLQVPDFTEVNSELITYLAAHPDDLHKLHWRKFEELLASIFENHGFSVEIGPGGGDGGVDLRLISRDSIGCTLTIVQAKNKAKKNKVDIEPVAALHGILDANKAHRGLFVTTSDFLPSARKFAEMHTYRLELAAQDRITQWLQVYAAAVPSVPSKPIKFEKFVVPPSFVLHDRMLRINLAQARPLMASRIG